MGPRHHLSFCACNTAWLAPKLLVSMGPNPYLWFLDAKQQLMDRNNKALWVLDVTCRFVLQNGVICTRMSSLYGFQPSSVFFFMQNSDFMTRLTSLYGSQTSSVVLSKHNSVINTRIKRLYGFQPSPVVLCMQNGDFITWITSFYGSQPSSEVFACKPETFGPKLHVSMGPRTHLWFSACKTACLASEILVSMCPSPHLWFLNAKQRILDQNYKSLRVPDLTCRFVHAIQCN